MTTGRDADAMSADYAAGRRDTLKEVAPWLRHKMSCLLYRAPDANECTCGLAALLKRLEGER